MLRVYVWLNKRLNRWYWVCNHDWCFREATYDYRCPKHMDDP